jgi:hypothetical protein
MLWAVFIFFAYRLPLTAYRQKALATGKFKFQHYNIQLYNLQQFLLQYGERLYQQFLFMSAQRDYLTGDLYTGTIEFFNFF